MLCTQNVTVMRYAAGRRSSDVLKKRAKCRGRATLHCTANVPHQFIAGAQEGTSLARGSSVVQSVVTAARAAGWTTCSNAMKFTCSPPLVEFSRQGRQLGAFKAPLVKEGDAHRPAAKEAPLQGTTNCMLSLLSHPVLAPSRMQPPCRQYQPYLQVNLCFGRCLHTVKLRTPGMSTRIQI